MSLGLGLGLDKRRVMIQPVATLPADGSSSPLVRYPRWPLIAVLPTPVVNGQSWNVGADMASAVEYLGVGGAWVAQATKQMAVWMWKMAGLLSNTVGFDSVRVTKTINWNSDFCLTLLYKKKSADTVAYSGLVCSSPDFSISSALTRGLWIERSNLLNSYTLRLNTSTGVSVVMLEFPMVLDSFTRTEIKRVGTLITIKNDGIIVASGTVSAGVVNTTSVFSIGSQTDARPGSMIVSYFQFCQGEGTITYGFEEESGSTVFDKTGSVDATIVDGAPTTFHSKDWVPIA